MKIDLTGKKALVTGGTSGLGLEMAAALREHGADVIALSRKDADFSLREYDLFYECDILVNNAGHINHQSIEDYSMWELHDDFDVMAFAPYALSRNVVDYMKTRGGGSIVNILSTAAYQGARNVSGYVAAKHALLGMTKCMAIEWAKYNIRVNAIAPGLFNTRMNSSMSEERKKMLEENIIPMGRFGRPDEITGALLFLVSEYASYITGTTVFVDGGWMAKNAGGF